MQESTGSAFDALFGVFDIMFELFVPILLVLLILGIVIALLGEMSEPSRRHHNNSVSKKKTKVILDNCPSCGVDIIPEDIYCYECGNKIIEEFDDKVSYIVR